MPCCDIRKIRSWEMDCTIFLVAIYIFITDQLTIVSGRTEIVAFSWSLVGILSGRSSALDSKSSEGGTFFSRLRSSHCASWVLSASSDIPYALIPLALHACWSSAGVSASMPSFSITWNEGKRFHPPLSSSFTYYLTSISLSENIPKNTQLIKN